MKVKSHVEQPFRVEVVRDGRGLIGVVAARQIAKGEVLIEEGTARVIRRRESIDDLLAHELEGLKSS